MHTDMQEHARGGIRTEREKDQNMHYLRRTGIHSEEKTSPVCGKQNNVHACRDVEQPARRARRSGTLKGEEMYKLYFGCEGLFSSSSQVKSVG